MAYNDAPYNRNSYNKATMLYVIRAEDTEEGKRRVSEYYQALGYFVNEFAKVEAILAQTLWYYTETKTEIAKIAFSGAQVDNTMTWIRQIALKTMAPGALIDDLTTVFDQLKKITGIRNHILHYGASSIAEGDGFVTDAFKAKGTPKILPIGPSDLKKLTGDLDKIHIHLAYKHLRRPRPRSIEGRELLDSIYARPWQYELPWPPPEQRKREAEPRLSDRNKKPRPESPKGQK